MHLIRPFRRLLALRRLLAGEMAHHAALGIENVDADRVGGQRRQIVVDENAGRRVLAHGRVRVNLVGIVEPITGLRLIEVCRRRRRCGRDLPQWSNVVENPECAAMGSDHEVVALDHQVVNRRARQAGVNAPPGLAAIARHEDERSKIVESMAVHCDIGCVRIIARWLNQTDRAPCGHFARSDIRPTTAAIAGELNKSVIGSDPNHSLANRRLCDGEDRVVIFNAGDVFGNRATGGLLLGFVVASEVGADGAPAATVIGRSIDALHAVIERVWIERRHS